MKNNKLFVYTLHFGITIVIISIIKISHITEQKNIIFSSININTKSLKEDLDFKIKPSNDKDLKMMNKYSSKNDPNLLKKLTNTNVTNGENNSATSVHLSNETLNELSIIVYRNISKELYNIERSMNRTLNQEEYVEIKEKYFSAAYFQDIYCLADIGDLLQEPNIQPIEDEGCNTPLLTINRFGRMGNQIAQYLSLFILHTMYNASVAMYPEMDAFLMLMFDHRSIPIIPVFCEKNYKRKTTSFNFIYTYLTIQSLLSEKLNETYEYDMLFKNPVIFMLSYPCPVDLFMRRRAYLKTELRILSHLQRSAKQKMKKLSSPDFLDSIIVSIHVRRTDYQMFAERYSHKLLSTNYYQRAMEFFRNNSRFGKVLFMVFSEDIQWCKENFSARDIVIAGDGDEVSPFIDFAMMSECDHHILGYGTFSFTAALLGRGLIVYPLPTVPRERVFGTQTQYLCSDSPELIPIPDVPLHITNNFSL